MISPLFLLLTDIGIGYFHHLLIYFNDALKVHQLDMLRLNFSQLIRIKDLNLLNAVPPHDHITPLITPRTQRAVHILQSSAIGGCIGYGNLIHHSHKMKQITGIQHIIFCNAIFSMVEYCIVPVMHIHIPPQLLHLFFGDLLGIFLGDIEKTFHLFF